MGIEREISKEAARFDSPQAELADSIFETKARIKFLEDVVCRALRSVKGKSVAAPLWDVWPLAGSEEGHEAQMNMVPE